MKSKRSRIWEADNHYLWEILTAEVEKYLAVAAHPKEEKGFDLRGTSASDGDSCPHCCLHSYWLNMKIVALMPTEMSRADYCTQGTSREQVSGLDSWKVYVRLTFEELKRLVEWLCCGAWQRRKIRGLHGNTYAWACVWMKRSKRLWNAKYRHSPSRLQISFLLGQFQY